MKVNTPLRTKSNVQRSWLTDVQFRSGTGSQEASLKLTRVRRCTLFIGYCNHSRGRHFGTASCMHRHTHRCSCCSKGQPHFHSFGVHVTTPWACSPPVLISQLKTENNFIYLAQNTLVNEQDFSWIKHGVRIPDASGAECKPLKKKKKRSWWRSRGESVKPVNVNFNSAQHWTLWPLLW